MCSYDPEILLLEFYSKGKIKVHKNLDTMMLTTALHIIIKNYKLPKFQRSLNK